MVTATRLGMMFRGPGASPWETPPIIAPPGQQLPSAGAPVPAMAPGALGGQITQVPTKPSFFGEGGTGRAIAGALGDALLSINHSAPIFAPMMQERRQQQRQEQQYQRNRADEQADWLARQQWEIEHPKPVNNDTINDFNFISQQLGSDAGKQYLQTLAAGPPMAVDSIDANGNTVRSFVPRWQLPGMGGGAAPQGAPTLPEGFKVRPKGGAGSQAPRTFQQ